MPTTPAKEIANAEHRILLLRGALSEEPKGARATMDEAEKLRLEDVRDGWQAEAEALRRAHHEHAALACGSCMQTSQRSTAGGGGRWGKQGR